MWVVNNKKQTAKIYLRSDVESSITNITDLCNRLDTVITAVNGAVGGSTVSADIKINDDCRIAIDRLTSALADLYKCRSYTDRFDTREWIDDDQY